ETRCVVSREEGHGNSTWCPHYHGFDIALVRDINVQCTNSRRGAGHTEGVWTLHRHGRVSGSTLHNCSLIVVVLQRCGNEDGFCTATYAKPKPSASVTTLTDPSAAP